MHPIGMLNDAMSFLNLKRVRLTSANFGRQFDHTQCALNVFERYGIQTLFQI